MFKMKPPLPPAPQSAPPLLNNHFTDHSKKTVLLLWFLSDTCCYVCVYLVSSGMVTCLLMSLNAAFI